MYPIPYQLQSALDASEDDVLGKIYDWRVIRRLPRYLTVVKSWMTWGTIGTVIRTAASLVSPYLIAKATDEFIQTGNLNGLNLIFNLGRAISGNTVPLLRRGRHIG
jgi:hypothetical protein